MARTYLSASNDASQSQYALGRIHSIESMGTVDGPGIRFVVFLQGCPMRCAYCHNPDTWEIDAGTHVSVEKLIEEFESNRAFYRTGGITVTGGEPLLQPEFLGDLFEAMHNDSQGKVHTCIDTSGSAYNSAHPERFEKVLDNTDLVLLDIKHVDPDKHKWLCGMSQDNVFAFADELCRRKIPVVIRHVIVPGITDSLEEVEALGRLCARWTNLVGLEFLPYHTMGTVKYEAMDLPYRLEGVPEMNHDKAAHLRLACFNALKEEHVRRSAAQQSNK